MADGLKAGSLLHYISHALTLVTTQCNTRIDLGLSLCSLHCVLVSESQENLAENVIFLLVTNLTQFKVYSVNIANWP